MGAVLGLGARRRAAPGAVRVHLARAVRGRGVGARLRTLLLDAGLAAPRRAASVALSPPGARVLGLLAVQVLSRTLPVALVFAVIAANAPFAALRGRVRRRRRELAEIWPEAVDDLASAVRAGLALPEAISGLAARGPEPLRPHFAAFALDYQVTGRFAESLDRLKARLADPVGDRVVEGAADRAGGGWRRPGQAAAQPVGLPAGGRAHPVGAGVPAGLDRERCPARSGSAVAGAAACLASSRR